MDEPDPKTMVRLGYDSASHLYRGDDDFPEPYAAWIAFLAEATPDAGQLLDLTFAPASFDTVGSFYALIHIPQNDQQLLIDRIGQWLKPGGLFLATVGHTEWTGQQPDWLDRRRSSWIHPVHGHQAQLDAPPPVTPLLAGVPCGREDPRRWSLWSPGPSNRRCA